MTSPHSTEDNLALFCCSACGEQRMDFLELLDSRDLIADPALSDPDSFSCATCGAIEFIGAPLWREQPEGRPRVVHLSVLQPVDLLRTLLAGPK